MRREGVVYRDRSLPYMPLVEELDLLWLANDLYTVEHITGKRVDSRGYEIVIGKTGEDLEITKDLISLLMRDLINHLYPHDISSSEQNLVRRRIGELGGLE